MIQIALASYPGFSVTRPPAAGTPFGFYRPAFVPQTDVPHVVVLADGTRIDIEPPKDTTDELDAGGVGVTIAEDWIGDTVRVPLGRLVHARSGDKGGDANLGVWIPADHPHRESAFTWLATFLDEDTVRDLLPEAADLDVEIHPLPNLAAVNVVIHGLLGEGVASSTRLDPQAKALGEWLRARDCRRPDRPAARGGRVVTILRSTPRAAGAARERAPVHRARDRPEHARVGGGRPAAARAARGRGQGWVDRRLVPRGGRRPGGDVVDSAVVAEGVLDGGGSSGVLASLFTHGIAIPHIVQSGNADLIDRYVRPTLAGEMIGSLGITEPGAGSDVASLRTRAVRDGDHYVVNGAKTFITSGVRADFVTTAVRTGGDGYGGISLLVIDKDTPGFTVAPPLKKMGWLCSDTAELTLRRRARAGREHRRRGERRLRPRHAAVRQRAPRARRAGVRHCATRARPGRPVREGARDVRQAAVVAAGHPAQARRHAPPHRRGPGLLGAGVRAGGERVDHRPRRHRRRRARQAAGRRRCEFVVHEAVQIYGGMGYMRESEVERHYRDARILGIGGGANEVLNDLAAKILGYA